MTVVLDLTTENMALVDFETARFDVTWKEIDPDVTSWAVQRNGVDVAEFMAPPVEGDASTGYYRTGSIAFNEEPQDETITIAVYQVRSGVRDTLFNAITVTTPVPTPVQSFRTQPRGIEAKWVINPGTSAQLVLNDRMAPECYFVDEIGGLYDPDIRDQREPNPDEDGETPYSALYSGRTLTFTGYIRALNLRRLREMETALKAATYDLSSERDFLIDVGWDYVNGTFRARKNANLDGREKQDSTYFKRNFMLSVRLSDPRFLSKLEKTASHAPNQSFLLGRIYDPTVPNELTGIPLGRHYPMLYDHSLDDRGFPIELPEIFTCLNEGNATEWPRIILTGPLDSPRIGIKESGQQMVFLVNLLIGQQLTIDTRPGRRTIIDEAGRNAFYALTPSSDWLCLLPGTNTVTCAVRTLPSDSETPAGIRVSWNDAWV